MDLILFGMQGSGKGTLGKELANKFGLEIFDTGGELRKLATQDSPLGKKIKKIQESGVLVSNKIVMEIVENFLQNAEKEKVLIFDGIPRSVIQAETLKALLEKNQRKYIGILLNISEETALKRLTTRKMCKKCKHIYPADYKEERCNQVVDSQTCNGELYSRADDVPDAIRVRLDAYRDSTLPAMELFKDNFIEIDGEPSIDEVNKVAFQKLSKILD